LAFLGFIGWRIVAKTRAGAQLQAQQEKRKKAAPSVELAVAKAGDIEQTIEAVGSAQSPYTVKLAAKTTGHIDYLEAREGTRVLPGQVLVTINPSDLQGTVYQQQAAVAEAQARLAQAAITQKANDTNVLAQIRQNEAGVSSSQANYDQTKGNFDAQVAAAKAQVTDGDAKVAQARDGIRSAQANLEAARANLADAQAKFNRTETLFKQQFVAAQDVDDARAAVAVQKGAVDVAVQQVASAKSALTSALALRDAAAKNETIVETKGRSDIEVARAALAQAKQSYRVARANISQTPAYRANLNALRAEVVAAQGQLTAAKAKLADTVLKSSIEGTVTARTADPGTVVTPGQQIMEIQYLKWLYVSVSLPVEQSSQVFTGQKAIVTFDALPGQTFVGTVSDLNPAADPTSRQFTIDVKLDNSREIIRPGMYGRAELVVKTIHAKVIVPREAVQNADTQPTVMVVGKDMVAHSTPVVLGASDGANYEILSGLQPGDRVVSLSYVPVKDGQKVQLGAAGPQKSGGPM
jgi:RND family efflux transporter MFP subunit